MISAFSNFRHGRSAEPLVLLLESLSFLAESALITLSILKQAGMQRMIGWLLLVNGAIFGLVFSIILVASKWQAGVYGYIICAMLAIGLGYLLVFDRDLGIYRQTLTD